MPTKYTPMAGRLLHLEHMRRYLIHSLAANEGLSWEAMRMLQHINRFPGCIQADLSNAVRVTAAAVTQSTKKLEAQGMIVKKTSEDNLRIKRLYITDKGRELLDKGTVIFDKTDNVMFCGFSDEELEDFMRFIDRIVKNLEDGRSKIESSDKTAENG